VVGVSGSPVSRVLYVGGSWRSGSTLLTRVLGSVPGHFAAGELRYLWTRGVIGNELCGCGRPSSDCELWQAVGERAFGSWKAFDVDRVVRLQETIDRPRVLLPWMLAGTGPHGDAIREYRSLLGTLYGALRDVTGADVIVDSSKNPLYAMLLGRSPGVSLRIVHLIRDSRGVAYSARKKVVRPEIKDGQTFMPRYSVTRAGLLWDAYNVLFATLALQGVPVSRLRYESLMEDPEGAIEGILHFAERPVRPETLAFLRGEHIELEPDHTVAGNPMRFQHGLVRLKPDREWTARMRNRDKVLVSLVTWPLLVRYGYAVRP
jgi:hypothetical protein